METIVSENWKAQIFVRSLWDFFSYQLHCDVLEDNGQPNEYSIKGIDDPDKITDIRFCVSIRENGRQTEGLVHELLHANLISLGYPRFWLFESRGSEKWKFAAGTINLADHIVMLPTYLALGYSLNRFIGPSRPLNERETKVQADLQRMSAKLTTPEGYLDCLSNYLERNNVGFKSLPLTNVIVAQRCAA